MEKSEKDKCHEDAKSEATLETQRTIPVNIKVTPLVIDGLDAVCRIEPMGSADETYVDAGLITLPPGPPVELNFHLQDGNYPGLQFDSNNPWSSRRRECPAPTANDVGKFPHVRLPDPKSLQVRAAPAAPNAMHYSLNFEGGARFDPIIIRD